MMKSKFIFLFLFLFYIHSVTSWTITPDDPFENQSLDICTRLYNSSESNQTLNCINFFDVLRHGNRTEIINITTIVNSTVTEDEIKDMINDHYNSLDNRTYITYQEFHNRITELEAKLKVTGEKSLEQIKEENRHKEEMAKISDSYASDTSVSSPSPPITDKPAINTIESAQQRPPVNQGPPPQQRNKNTVFDYGMYLLVFIIAVVIIFTKVKKFLSKKSVTTNSSNRLSKDIEFPKPVKPTPLPRKEPPIKEAPTEDGKKESDNNNKDRFEFS